MRGEASRYRILRLLGRGGMAEVFEARVAGEGGFERKVALKRLLADATGDDGFLASFTDEARIVSQLHHAGIVGVFDFGLMDGLPFLVFELVEGLDVEALATRALGVGRPMPVELALHVVTEVAHALDYAHHATDALGQRLGVVHRDVSPENVLVSWQGDVKLADFGIAFARRRLEATAVGVAKGKRAYMAPEQVAGSAVDLRADVWALGCVLHRLIAGRSPIADDASELDRREGTNLALDPRLDHDVRAIVERATRPRREDRFATAAELARAAGRAMIDRLQGDARTAMRAWIGAVRPEDETVRPRRGADLVDLDLVFAGSGDAPLRRFESRVRAASEVVGRGGGEVIVGEAHEASLTERAPVAPSGVLGAEEAEDPEAVVETELTRAEQIAVESRVVRDHLIGDVIASYRITALLGAGYSARVFRARHLVLDRDVAVKVVHPKHLRHRKVGERLRREAKALARVAHPNVVGVIDAGTTPGGLGYVVTELVEGRTLAKLVQAEAPLAPDRAAYLVRQLAAGLAAAHAAGLVHRDLKPGNVMVSEPGETVKILDFGLARALHDDAPKTKLTRAEDLLGTPQYMAPEQILGASSVGPEADLYALGVVLYELLTGRRPFEGHAVDAIAKHLREPAPPLPDSGGLGPIATRLLEKDPPARYASASEVLAAIDALDLDHDGDRTDSRVPSGRKDTARRDSAGRRGGAHGERSERDAVEPGGDVGDEPLGTKTPIIAARSVGDASAGDRGKRGRSPGLRGSGEPGAPELGAAAWGGASGGPAWRIEPGRTPRWLFAAIGVLALGLAALFLLVLRRDEALERLEARLAAERGERTSPASEPGARARPAAVARAAVDARGANEGLEQVSGEEPDPLAGEGDGARVPRTAGARDRNRNVASADEDDRSRTTTRVGPAGSTDPQGRAEPSRTRAEPSRSPAEPSRSPAEPSRSPAEPRAARVTIPELRGRLAAALARRGLDTADLAGSERTRADAEAFERASSRGDVLAADAALSGLLDEVARFPIGAPFLRAKLERTSGRIRAAAKALPSEVIDRLEARYFELREAVRADLDDAEAATLAARIAALDAELLGHLGQR